MLSEHHNKEHKKRTQQRSATMFAVFQLCVLRDTFRLTPVMGCAHMDDHRACHVTSAHTLSTTTKEDWKTTSAVLWQCGWSGTNRKKKEKTRKKTKQKKRKKNKKKQKGGKAPQKKKHKKWKNPQKKEKPKMKGEYGLEPKIHPNPVISFNAHQT